MKRYAKALGLQVVAMGRAGLAVREMNREGVRPPIQHPENPPPPVRPPLGAAPVLNNGSDARELFFYIRGEVRNLQSKKTTRGVHTGSLQGLHFRYQEMTISGTPTPLLVIPPSPTYLQGVKFEGVAASGSFFSARPTRDRKSVLGRRREREKNFSEDIQERGGWLPSSVLAVLGSQWCGESGEPFRKTHPNSPDRDSNLDLPAPGSLVYCKSSALANYATEADTSAIVYEGGYTSPPGTTSPSALGYFTSIHPLCPFPTNTHTPKTAAYQTILTHPVVEAGLLLRRDNAGAKYPTQQMTV
uniref:Uncharacterized protein n=1 Tax=Timema bartmani TaxID=61472 RepID=A0A7R9EN06_9NEOP|nr:unnamed protein product [Timema bartmani]